MSRGTAAPGISSGEPGKPQAINSPVAPSAQTTKPSTASSRAAAQRRMRPVGCKSLEASRQPRVDGSADDLTWPLILRGDETSLSDLGSVACDRRSKSFTVTVPSRCTHRRSGTCNQRRMAVWRHHLPLSRTGGERGRWFAGIGRMNHALRFHQVICDFLWPFDSRTAPASPS